MQCDVNQANQDSGIEQSKGVYLASRCFIRLEEQSHLGRSVTGIGQMFLLNELPSKMLSPPKSLN